MDGTLYYVHQDHLGSTVAVSDEEGQAMGRVQYDPYGEIISSTLPVALTDRLFTGQRWHGTIGLYQMGARWYDPTLGRWLQADSIVPEPGNPQALNRYAYAANSPLNFIDPNGHQVRPQESCDSICYTGTLGPYNVEMASPAVQPLTTASYQTSHDVYLTAAPAIRDDAGVLLLYANPGYLRRREELIPAHAERPVCLVEGEVQGRHVSVYESLFGGDVLKEYDELVASGGVGPMVPILGKVGVGMEYASGEDKWAFYGKVNVLGGQVELQPGQLMMGYAAPLAGPGGRIGAEWDMGGRQFFVTSYGYWSELGQKGFGKRHAPGMSLVDYSITEGYWSRGRWVSGLSVLHTQLTWKYNMPYIEQPGSIVHAPMLLR
jgi:RHS repeat-associated protein